jgi:hypothetical protein
MRGGILIIATTAALAVLAAPAAAAPPGPTNARVTDVRASGATLTWAAPATTRPVYGYTIVDLNNPFVNNGVGWSFTTTGTADLQPVTTYRLAVRALYADTFEDSELSNAITVTTPRDTTPPAAPILHHFSHTSTSVLLGFDGAQDDVGVDAWVVSNGERTWSFPAWQQWQQNLTGLETNRVHVFTLRARDAAGNLSPASASVSVLIENHPPTPPANLRVEGDRLRWDAATDDSGSIAGYTTFVDGVAHRATTGLEAPLRVLDPVTGELTPGPGTHTYTVKARDPSGNLSAPSNAVTVTIP